MLAVVEEVAPRWPEAEAEAGMLPGSNPTYSASSLAGITSYRVRDAWVLPEEWEESLSDFTAMGENSMYSSFPSNDLGGVGVFRMSLPGLVALVPKVLENEWDLRPLLFSASLLFCRMLRPRLPNFSPPVLL